MPPSILAESSLNPTGLAIFLLLAYFVPSVVARVRHVPNAGSVYVVNLFLGWTFIGWVVALAMAARSTAPTRTTA